MWCIGGKTERYECYGLWAQHQRTPYKKYVKFDFDSTLKNYLPSVCPNDIVDAEPPPGAVVVSAKHYVKFVVRYLDEAF